MSLLASPGFFSSPDYLEVVAMRSAFSRPSLITRLAKTVVPRTIRPSQFLGFQIRARAKNQIQSGPFHGMKYLDHSYWNLHYPKLFGPMNEFRPKELCWMIMLPRTGNA